MPLGNFGTKVNESNKDKKIIDHFKNVNVQE